MSLWSSVFALLRVLSQRCWLELYLDLLNPYTTFYDASLFNLQGAFRRSSSDNRSTILPHLFRFVKNFFRSFSKLFFDLVFSPAASQRPVQYTTSFSVCQVLFSSSLKTFFDRSLLNLSCRATAWLFYHRFFLLSRTFFILFKIYFPVCLSAGPRSQATRLVYLISPLFVNPFFLFSLLLSIIPLYSSKFYFFC